MFGFVKWLVLKYFSNDIKIDKAVVFLISKTILILKYSLVGIKRKSCFETALKLNNNLNFSAAGKKILNWCSSMKFF